MGVICILLLVNIDLTGDELNGGDEGSEHNGSKNMDDLHVDIGQQR